MKRRDVIIIAVLVNVGLLAVLFVAALKGGSSEPAVAVNTEKTSIEQPASDVVAVEETQQNSVDKVVHRLPQAMEDDKAIEESGKNYTEVTVKRGDSLEKIAKVHHTTVARIKEINNLPGNFLRLGQTLLIDNGSKLGNSTAKAVAIDTTEKTVEKQAQYYVVKVGDNPWTIAIKHHMKLNDLLKLNHLDNHKAKKLKAGDKLRVK